MAKADGAELIIRKWYKSFVFTDALSAEEIAELRGWVESEVRGKLGIPFNVARAAQRFEHSMGQGLPASGKRRPTPCRLILKPSTALH